MRKEIFLKEGVFHAGQEMENTSIIQRFLNLKKHRMQNNINAKNVSYSDMCYGV